MKFPEEQLTSPSINLIPILDCIFVLIFVFMFMLLNVAKREGLNLSLPISQAAKPLYEPELITIELTNDNKIHLHNRQLSLKELDRELEFVSLEAHPPALVIKGDRDTPLSQTIKVLDLVKKYGFSNVTIETSRQ
ncbi:MAG: biopolymer transporter ExbD [Bdellovibrionaceae bacterium]|nr:biopolymer transporter ExbD [Pseudobdellovibrionaceae bacterium]